MAQWAMVPNKLQGQVDSSMLNLAAINALKCAVEHQAWL